MFPMTQVAARPTQSLRRNGGAAHDALGPALGILVPIDDYDELAFDPDGAYDEDVACWFDDGVDRQAVKHAVEEFPGCALVVTSWTRPRWRSRRAFGLACASRLLLLLRSGGCAQTSTRRLVLARLGV